jgi:hypothetical protein
MEGLPIPARLALVNPVKTAALGCVTLAIFSPLTAAAPVFWLLNTAGFETAGIGAGRRYYIVEAEYVTDKSRNVCSGDSSRNR